MEYKEEKITVKEAYQSMMIFLDNYYQRGSSSDEIPILLGSMQLHSEGGSFDAAQWEDWKDAVEEIRNLKK